MSCPPQCSVYSRPGSGRNHPSVRRRLDFDSTNDSGSPTRLSRSPQGRPSDRYDSFKRATRSAVHSATMDSGIQQSGSYQGSSTICPGAAQYQPASQYFPSDISDIAPPSPSRMSPLRTPQATYPGSRPTSPRPHPPKTPTSANARMVSPIPMRQQRQGAFRRGNMTPPVVQMPHQQFSEISERPSETIHSTTISERPGQHVVTEEVKEIYDRSSRSPSSRAQCPGATGRGNATFDVTPIGGSRQVSFVPPGDRQYDTMQRPATNLTDMSELFDSSDMFDSEGTGFYDRSSPVSKRDSVCPSNATYTVPNTTYNVPNASYNLPTASYNAPNATYGVSKRTPPSYPSGAQYDHTGGSGTPFETTVSEEVTEYFDSSDEMDESLLGKVLRGEIGRNIQPMTPSDPSIRPDATYTKANSLNATYSVTPVHSQPSVECACSKGESSLSFNPGSTSAATKKDINRGIESELSRREKEEREQLENDLRRWQKARRRLVLDTTHLSATPT